MHLCAAAADAPCARVRKPYCVLLSLTRCHSLKSVWTLSSVVESGERRASPDALEGTSCAPNSGQSRVRCALYRRLRRLLKRQHDFTESLDVFLVETFVTRRTRKVLFFVHKKGNPEIIDGSPLSTASNIIPFQHNEPTVIPKFAR